MEVFLKLIIIHLVAAFLLFQVDSKGWSRTPKQHSLNPGYQNNEFPSAQQRGNGRKILNFNFGPQSAEESIETETVTENSEVPSEPSSKSKKKRRKNKKVQKRRKPHQLSKEIPDQPKDNSAETYDDSELLSSETNISEEDSKEKSHGPNIDFSIKRGENTLVHICIVEGSPKNCSGDAGPIGRSYRIKKRGKL